MGQGLPHQPTVLPNGWIGKAVLVGEDTSQEAGASRAAVGVWTQLPCGGRGQSQPGQETSGVPSPHSRGRVYGTPTSLALLPFGDERLSLPRLRVGAWVTEAALYSLGAGAVTWSGGEDIVGAWG